MRTRQILLLAPLALALAHTPRAHAAASFFAFELEDQAPDSPQEKHYSAGTEALDAKRWDKAAQEFADAARIDGARADAALYWKAYAESRLGRRADAAGTLGALKKRFPKSRWLKDARALEIEMRQGADGAAGAAGEDAPDDELKLIAINSLAGSDPERAIPLLEKILAGNGSEEMKERALFVLTQSGSPKARSVVAEIARGRRNADLQEEAIRYLGTVGGRQSHDLLAEIYASGNAQAKESVLHAYMTSGDRERLLAAAKGEKSPELRETAIQLLGAMGDRASLWQLYQTETSADVKGAILNGLATGGDVEHVAELARTEKNPELRAEAIQRLGIMGTKTEPILVSIFKAEKDPELRDAALNGLFVQGSSHALIELARAEKNREMKAEIVQKLSTMHSKEATEYMLEILNK